LPNYYLYIILSKDKREIRKEIKKEIYKERNREKKKREKKGFLYVIAYTETHKK
jgi:hypothetical protein